MIRTRLNTYARAAAATLAVTAGMAGIGQAPAYAATAVRGEAYGYYSNVSLFGGPYTLLGYGQAGSAPAVAATPSVTLPSTGGSVSQTDSDGSKAAYGPAVIFGWYDTATDTYVNSGSETVVAQGTISGSGSVLSRATVVNAGPGPLVMPQIQTTCSRSGATTVATVTVSNGFVETSTNASTGDVTSTQSIPSSPTAGTRINGTLNHIGDSFHIIFNEQTTNADGSKKIVGAHMYLDGPTAVGDLVIAVATCGVTA